MSDFDRFLMMAIPVLVALSAAGLLALFSLSSARSEYLVSSYVPVQKVDPTRPCYFELKGVLK